MIYDNMKSIILETWRGEYMRDQPWIPSVVRSGNTLYRYRTENRGPSKMSISNQNKNRLLRQFKYKVRLAEFVRAGVWGRVAYGTDINSDVDEQQLSPLILEVIKVSFDADDFDQLGRKIRITPQVTPTEPITKMPKWSYLRNDLLITGSKRDNYKKNDGYIFKKKNKKNNNINRRVHLPNSKMKMGGRLRSGCRR
jgi:hypothetical protein